MKRFNPSCKIFAKISSSNFDMYPLKVHLLRETRKKFKENINDVNISIFIKSKNYKYSFSSYLVYFIVT